MIVFDLRCGEGHVFEAWFRDGAAFEAQREAGEIACPVCADSRVAKAPMAPRVARGVARGEGETREGQRDSEAAAGALERRLREARRLVERHCEDVGERFPEEVRRIHYGETEKRGIYGEASKDEVRALTDEGIEVHRVPWLRRHQS